MGCGAIGAVAPSLRDLSEYSDGEVSISCDTTPVTYNIKGVNKASPIASRVFKGISSQDLAYMDWSFNKESFVRRSEKNLQVCKSTLK